MIEFMETALFCISVYLYSLVTSYVLSVIIRLLNKSRFTNLSYKIFLTSAIVFFIFIGNQVLSLYSTNYVCLKPITFIIFVPIIIHKLFKIDLLQAFFTSIICLLVFAFIEIIISMIIPLFGIEFKVSNSSYISSILFSIVIQAFALLISFILLKINKLFSTNKPILNSISKYFLPQFLTISICLFPTMMLLMIKDFSFSILFIFVNFLQLLVVSIVSVYNIKNVIKQKNTECELLNTATYNQTLIKVNEGVRGFKHDMSNIVQAILGYTAVNDIEGVKKYCQNLVIGFNDINILSILSPEVINDPAIYGVVVSKILMAREKNMTLCLDVNTNVAAINLPKFELSRILGILIDNAIECGENTKEKKLIVNMHHDYKKKCDVIIISNSIKDTNIDLCKIFDKNFSTKQKPSGFGLYEVVIFLDKYSQGYIVPSIDREKMLFTQTLTIQDEL